MTAKFFDEKTAKICTDLDLLNDQAWAIIRKALAEQDRDTRHACAEAVLLCPEDVSGQFISKDEAHNACMNAR